MTFFLNDELMFTTTDFRSSGGFAGLTIPAFTTMIVFFVMLSRAVTIHPICGPRMFFVFVSSFIHFDMGSDSGAPFGPFPFAARFRVSSAFCFFFFDFFQLFLPLAHLLCQPLSKESLILL